MGSCKLLAPLSRISQPGCIMPHQARIIIFLHNVPRIIMPPATMLYRGGVEQNFTDFARFTHFLANLANFHALYKEFCFWSAQVRIQVLCKIHKPNTLYNNSNLYIGNSGCKVVCFGG